LGATHASPGSDFSAAGNPPGLITVRPAGELYSMSAGQWCAGYRGDTVLFGGIIEGVEYAG